MLLWSKVVNRFDSSAAPPNPNQGGMQRISSTVILPVSVRISPEVVFTPDKGKRRVCGKKCACIDNTRLSRTNNCRCEKERNRRIVRSFVKRKNCGNKTAAARLQAVVHHSGCDTRLFTVSRHRTEYRSVALTVCRLYGSQKFANSCGNKVCQSRLRPLFGIFSGENTIFFEFLQSQVSTSRNPVITSFLVQ